MEGGKKVERKEKKMDSWGLENVDGKGKEKKVEKKEKGKAVGGVCVKGNP